MLKLENVAYTYPNGIKSLNKVTFSVSEYENVGLIGSNGAGKSTLLYMISGVLLPSDGIVTIAGKVLNKSTVNEIRNNIGLVFQESDDQLFTTTVFDDVAFGIRNMGAGDGEVKSAAENALELCGIAGLSGRAPYKLSGGEKKLAAIASVIVMKPKLILMDEPSASLDPKSRRRIISLLPSLKCAKIIASHDLDLVWDVCERVIVLKEGRAVADGRPEEILTDEALLISAGLELPLSLQPRKL